MWNQKRSLMSISINLLYGYIQLPWDATYLVLLFDTLTVQEIIKTLFNADLLRDLNPGPAENRQMLWP